MSAIVGVRFRTAGKLHYFNAEECELSMGDDVIAETSRGLEYGTVLMMDPTLPEKEQAKPLGKIRRKATEEDQARNEENRQKRGEAMAKCREKIEEHGLDMKLIDVEHTFDGNKIIFYFTADGRVDFRELVKDLASVFRTRIELRQVGVRDEAKMMGGVGNCGRGLCCHQWMRDFQPVSIKMAKTQNLSLNPTKISGICGRLMCCLNYENDIYSELRKGMPFAGEHVTIPEGPAVVMESNILEQKIRCRVIVEPRDEEQGTPEKLSSEVYTYGKDEVERSERPRKERRRNRKQSKRRNKAQKT